eukprot:PLAT8022.1.p1 GENE.PLAT8022.1~~PLAT8022.1.p1  ORF type:complete len:735 (+),score=402.47 PLAT8022.1:42-2207(+)
MEPEFSTSSSDRVERVEARKQRRIARRAARADGEAGKKKRESEGKKETSRGKQQIADSLAHLDKKKAKSIETVTSVRVEGDERENARRIVEEEKRQDRLRRLQEEAVTSGKHNAAIELRWAELMERSIPQELLAEIKAQKAACRKTIESKDMLIREFQTELKSKDEEYVKTLKRQAEEVETLMDHMSTQFKELQEAYEVELEQIEDAFLKERHELLASNKGEIDALFEKRRNMEIRFMEEKQAREEGYMKRIEELMVEDAEKFSKLKIKLQTDIQTLEQQLGEMRATYQLNTEKLEYNYRVLTERDIENTTMINLQRKKIIRLKEARTQLMHKYMEMDAAYKQRNMALTEEYRKVTKQYKDLQIKFRHFEAADHRKYEEVWAMHEDEVSQLATKLLKADEIIHQQQLGWQWLPPKERVLRDAASFRPLIVDPSKESEAGGGGAAGGGSGAAGEGDGADAKPKSYVSMEKLRKMLELLGSEASFLVDPKVAASLEGMEADEAAIFRSESILRALNVESEEDVERLLSYFFEDEDTLEGVDGEEALVLGLKVAPDDVVPVIRKYMEDREELKRSEGRGRKRAVMDATLDARMELARREDRDFWERMATVVPDRTIRVWTALEAALQKYNGVLESRTAAIEEVGTLEEENARLKELLGAYLSSDTTKELLIPPTAILHVDSRSAGAAGGMPPAAVSAGSLPPSTAPASAGGSRALTGHAMTLDA